MKRKYFLNGNEFHLSEEPKQKWTQQLIDAFTDPNKAFNFPIKYPAIDLDPSTKKTVIIAAGVLGLSLIAMGALIGRNK